MSQKRFYRSGELARRFGISPDTLRHYERMGLMVPTPRSSNRYRAYPPQTIDRLNLIRTALSVGFTIRELSEILQARDQGKIPCKKVRDLAVQKLHSVEAQLRELTEARATLQRTLKDWNHRLNKSSPHRHARLLESLVRTKNKQKGES
jgi:MerR family transcriptional regulator, Zn(II)-responsive regulator of zntA